VQGSIPSNWIVRPPPLPYPSDPNFHQLTTRVTADEGVNTTPAVGIIIRPLTTAFFSQGATRMSGGVPLITLPAGYLGSSFLGACMITCGFNTNASKIATLVLAVIFVLALFWARKQLLSVRTRLHFWTGTHTFPAARGFSF
jgi:hypothetical protein